MADEERAQEASAQRAQARAERTQRFLSGEVNLPEAERVNVVDERTGALRSVPTAELLDTLSITNEGGGRAYSIATDDDVRTHRLRSEAEGQTAETALYSAVSGATLGLSDAALLAGIEAVHGEEARRRRAERLITQREVNPTAAAGGELVGAVAPMLVPAGAAGALARAGGTAGRVAGAGATALRYAPAGVVGRGAMALEGAAANALARAGVGRTTSRVLAGAVGGAAEGAAYGAGQAISESALGDTELTAERLGASIGLGTLLGAGGGAVLPAAGALLGATARAGGRVVARATHATGEALSRVWERTHGTPLREGARDLYVRGATLMTGGKHEGFISRATALTAEGRALRRTLESGEDVAETAMPRLREALDTEERIAQVTEDFSRGELKRSNIRRLMPDDAGVHAANDADRLLQSASRLADDIETHGQVYEAAGRGAGRELWGAIDEYSKRIAAAAGAGRTGAYGRDVATDTFIALDQLKRKVGRLHNRVRRGRDTNASESFDRLYHEFRDALEHTAYGEAGLAQKEINAAWARRIANSSVFSEKFLSRSGTQEGFEEVYTADPAALIGYMNRSGTAAAKLDDEIFERQIVANREFLETVEKHFDLPDELRGAIKEGHTNAAALTRELDNIRDVIQARNQLRELQKDEGQFAGFGLGGLLTAGAVALDSPEYAPLTFAAGAIARPSRAIRAIATIERVVGDLDKALLSRVRNFIREGPAPNLGAPPGVRMSRAERAANVAMAPVTWEAFSDKAREVTDAVEKPEDTADRLASRTATFAAEAPRTAMHLDMLAHRGAQFLYDRIPRGAKRHPLEIAMRTSQPPISDAEIAKFMRYSRAVENPMTVLDDMSSGRLSVEAVEAMREVYPRLYEDVRTKVLTELADESVEVTYTQRVQVGVLFQYPTVPSLRPERLAMIQANYAAPPDQSAPNAPTGKAPDIARVAGFASPMDAFEARRG